MDNWGSSGNVRIDSGYCDTDQSNLSTGEVCFGAASQVALLKVGDNL